MVRLKGIGRYPNLSAANKFQFLHGSIKSNNNIHDNTCYNKFQFLHGSIKSKLLPTKPPA